MPKERPGASPGGRDRPFVAALRVRGPAGARLGRSGARRRPGRPPEPWSECRCCRRRAGRRRRGLRRPRRGGGRGQDRETDGGCGDGGAGGVAVAARLGPVLPRQAQGLAVPHGGPVGGDGVHGVLAAGRGSESRNAVRVCLPAGQQPGQQRTGERSGDGDDGSDHGGVSREVAGGPGCARGSGPRCCRFRRDFLYSNYELLVSASPDRRPCRVPADDGIGVRVCGRRRPGRCGRLRCSPRQRRRPGRRAGRWPRGAAGCAGRLRRRTAGGRGWRTRTGRRRAS